MKYAIAYIDGKHKLVWGYIERGILDENGQDSMYDLRRAHDCRKPGEHPGIMVDAKNTFSDYGSAQKKLKEMQESA